MANKFCCKDPMLVPSRIFRILLGQFFWVKIYLLEIVKMLLVRIVCIYHLMNILLNILKLI
jgi:hypothetical protein